MRGGLGDQGWRASSLVFVVVVVVIFAVALLLCCCLMAVDTTVISLPCVFGDLLPQSPLPPPLADGHLAC